MENTQLTNLYFQLHRFARLATRQHHMNRHDTGHSPMLRGQDRLLGILMGQDGVPQKEIVEKMDIRPSSAGELVEKLEEAGYVEKRPSEADKRIVNIYLTEPGRQTALQTARIREGMLEGIFSALDVDERTQLTLLLEKLNASLQDNAPERRGMGRRHGCGCGGEEAWYGPHGPHGPHGEHDPGGHCGHHGHHCPPPPPACGGHPMPPRCDDPAQD